MDEKKQVEVRAVLLEHDLTKAQEGARAAEAELVQLKAVTHIEHRAKMAGEEATYQAAKASAAREKEVRLSSCLVLTKKRT